LSETSPPYTSHSATGAVHTRSIRHLNITQTVPNSSSFVIPLDPLVTLLTPIRADDLIGRVVVGTTNRAIAILRFVADGVAANAIGDGAECTAFNAPVVACLLWSSRGSGGSGVAGIGGGGGHGARSWCGTREWDGGKKKRCCSCVSGRECKERGRFAEHSQKIYTAAHSRKTAVDNVGDTSACTTQTSPFHPRLSFVLSLSHAGLLVF